MSSFAGSDEEIPDVLAELWVHDDHGGHLAADDEDAVTDLKAWRDAAVAAQDALAAAAAIREIASARAASPALARAITKIPLRGTYDLCRRSEMTEGDRARLDWAAAVLDAAKEATQSW